MDETWPEEYRNNPFIAALPDPFDPRSALKALTVLLPYDEAQRLLPHPARIAYTGRLVRYLFPLSQHLDLEQRIGMLIRDGYVGRNPASLDYVHGVLNNAERCRRVDLNSYLIRQKSTAEGFAIIGESGMGKSTTIDHIFSMYQQAIKHADPAMT